MAHVDRKRSGTQVDRQGTTVVSNGVDGRCEVHLVCPWCEVATQTSGGILAYDITHAYLFATCMQRETCGRGCLLRIEHGEPMRAAKGEVPVVRAANMRFSATVYPTRQVTYE